MSKQSLQTPQPAATPRWEAARRPFSLKNREGPWKNALLRRMLAGADVIAVLVAAAGAANFSGGTATALWATMLLPLWILIAKVHGLYDSDHARIKHLTTDELPNLFYWVTLSTAASTLILTLSPAPLTAAGAMAMWLNAIVVSFVLRVAARAIWRRVVPAERGLVVGDGPLADAVARKLQLEPGHHLELVAAIALADHPARPLAISEPRLSVTGLRETIADERIERVVLAVSDLDEATLSGVVVTCRTLGIKLSVAPPLRAMLGTAVRLNHLAELPFIEFKTWDASRSTQLIKRSVDVVGSATLLLLMLPLMAVIALLIKLDSPGPAFFTQARAGRRGRPFTMVKFRTMVADAEERLSEVVRIDELTDPMFKLRADPRVTRIGRRLRRWSVDELPQLINVLRGEMSLVGPRPEEVRLVERYDADLAFRLDVRPGITGPMQVHGRGELNFQERIAVEREYVENYSLRKDFKLLIRTLPAVLRRHGAF
jgi:exopolysaccharide biosynthesis polyprenyl glycosylphosphotransferase